MRARLLFTGSLVGVALAACTFNPGPPGSGLTGTGTGTPGRGGSTGITGGAGSTGTGTGTGTGLSSGAGNVGGNGEFTPDASCGQVTVNTQNLPPDILIILDKSGSMANDFNDVRCQAGTTCMDKWTAMQTAITQVVTATNSTVNWGLKFFSDDGTCGAMAAPVVAVAPNSAAAVNQQINGARPAGNTPTRVAEESGAAYVMTLTDPNPKYILLATDGEPNCMPGARNNTTGDDQGAITAVGNAFTAGVPTFVVGVGNVMTAQATLNSMATMGGRPQTGAATSFYAAADPAALTATLMSIAGQVASCTFSLQQVPPDPSNIAVLGDNKAIPKSADNGGNGWQYGPGMMSVELTGTYCDQFKGGQIASVNVIFGCPGVVIIVPT